MRKKGGDRRAPGAGDGDMSGEGEEMGAQDDPGA